jgi:thioredoxin-related protein
MKKQFYGILLVGIMLSLTGCGVSSQNNPDNQTTSEENVEKTLNNLMLIFGDQMEQYLENGKKDLKELEKLHLAFVPILRWEDFKGDDNYKKAALSVGSIVHQLEDLNGDEYEQLLSKLKPAYTKFYSQFGE